MAKYYGYNPPFLGGPQNVLSRQEDDRLIKNDIIQLLLTVPGERVMRPDYGVNIRSFIFEQMVQRDINRLRREIFDALETYEPRVDVQDVIIKREDDLNRISIRILVNMKNDPERQLTIEQFIDLTVGA